jgi:hypothetical protein
MYAVRWSGQERSALGMTSVYKCGGTLISFVLPLDDVIGNTKLSWGSQPFLYQAAINKRVTAQVRTEWTGFGLPDKETCATNNSQQHYSHPHRNGQRSLTPPQAGGHQ